jgi:integrase/recombinase XerD
MTLVRNIAAMANRPDLISQVPRAAAPLARRNVADPADLLKLKAAAPGWLRCAILLASHAAFRRSDVLRIAPEHYDAERKLITIAQKKTGQTVTVPVTDELDLNLQSAPHADNPATPFLELYAGKPVGAVMLNKSWNRLKKTTRSDKTLNFHDLRRTVAVSLYEVSKDLRVVEQMLGHQSLSSTIRYLEHRDPAKLRPYLDAIHKPTGRVQ